MSPRPGGVVSNSSEFATLGSGEWKSAAGDTTCASAALALIRARPTFSLILAYLIVTIVSRMHDVWFFRDFRINIFNYSGATDFFMAPMRNPIIVLFFLVPAVGMLLVVRLIRVFRRKRSASSAVRGESGARRSNRACVPFVASVILVLASATVLTRLHANNRSDTVKAGHGKFVSFARSDRVAIGERPLLLGSTGKFFFFYFPRKEVTEIVPVENTALVTVESQPHPESVAAPPAGAGKPPFSP